MTKIVLKIKVLDIHTLYDPAAFPLCPNFLSSPSSAVITIVLLKQPQVFPVIYQRQQKLMQNA